MNEVIREEDLEALMKLRIVEYDEMASRFEMGVLEEDDLNKRIRRILMGIWKTKWVKEMEDKSSQTSAEDVEKTRSQLRRDRKRVALKNAKAGSWERPAPNMMQTPPGGECETGD